ncbi:MAG: 50S ribosomal protein L29 [Spirochaetales bacterium]|nr:50S ribosomal protein L29 [Spirochaetales bacterium]
MKESYNDLTFNELLTKREELKKKYRDIRFNMVIGHVDNPLQKRVLRRRLARLNTLINEYQCGIRKANVAGERGQKDEQRQSE